MAETKFNGPVIHAQPSPWMFDKRNAYQAFVYGGEGKWPPPEYGATPEEARDKLERRLAQSPQAQAVLQQVDDNQEAFYEQTT